MSHSTNHSYSGLVERCLDALVDACEATLHPGQVVNAAVDVVVVALSTRTVLVGWSGGWQDCGKSLFDIDPSPLLFHQLLLDHQELPCDGLVGLNLLRMLASDCLELLLQ